MAGKLIPSDERRYFAAAAGLNEQYLYQCLTGRRDMSPAEAVRVETITGCRLRRWDLCQSSWHRIWPELIGLPDAPAVPEAASA